MSGRFDVEKAIYQSRNDSGIRGKRVTIENLYIWKPKQAVVALISKNNLDGKEGTGTFSYGIYSMMIDAAVSESSDAFQKLTEELPDLSALTDLFADQPVDFLRKLVLQDQERDMVAQYIENGFISPEYASVLKELAGMVSPEAAKVYEFFFSEL